MININITLTTPIPIAHIDDKPHDSQESTVGILYDFLGSFKYI